MLPKNLKYGSKVESAVARSIRTNIAPQNGTGPYSYGDTIIFNIPTRNNLVLASTESYLKFKMSLTNGTNGNAFRWDSGGCHHIISRIRVFHGSNLIEDIAEYGLLAKILYDLQLPADNTYGKQTLLSGTRQDLVLTTPAVAAVADISQKNLSAVMVNSGDRFGAAIGANLSAAAAVLTEDYAINLISLVGSLSSSNYVPLFAMSSAPLRVEITLVDSLYKAMADLTDATGTASTLALTNVEYVGNFIELGDSAMSVIYGSLEGQPLQYVIPQYRNYQFTFALANAVATQVTFPIPAKFSSLKALLVTTRDKGTGAATFFPCSSVKMGLQQYQFRIGASVVPSKPASTNVEFFSEALKAMGSLSDINFTPSIDKSSYTLNVSAANNDVAAGTSSVQSGSFYIGLDLEGYQGAPKEQLFAGANTNTDDIFCILDYIAPSAITARFDCFSNYDCVLIFENNTCYCKF